MAITKRVQQELVEATPTAAASLGATASRPSASAVRRRNKKDVTLVNECSGPQKLTKAQREAAAERSKGKAWTAEEHMRFLEALERFPAGPWKAIANYVGTKNSRQTMTHAQKCREKHERKTRVQRRKASSKKTRSKRVSTRRQPSRRRASTPESAAPARRSQASDQEGAVGNESDAATDEGEDMDHDEDVSDYSRQQDDESKDDMEESSLIMLDEVTFFSGCDDALAATTSAGSPPFLSLLSLQDPAVFSSDDLWHTQSLADVALGVGSHGGEHDATTDLDDLHDLAAGLSQECW